MSRNILCNLSKLSACAGFLACLAHGNSVFADQADPPVVTMTVASSRISQGEPFVIHYKVENSAPEGQLTFYAGPDNDQWYTLTLRGPNRLLIAIPKAPEKKLEGFSAVPEITVSHRDSFTSDFIATRGLPLLPPGTYHLSVHVDAPFYAIPDGVGPLRFNSPGFYDPPTGTMVQDFTFPLVVTPADPVKLRALAEQWKTALLNPAQDASWRLLTKELFSLPAAQALPAWQALIADPASDSNILEDAVSQLSRLKTDTAADLLVQMQHRPSTARSATPSVEGALAEMYNTGSPALRKHIKALAAAQGAELGETMIGPSNPN